VKGSLRPRPQGEDDERQNRGCGWDLRTLKRFQVNPNLVVRDKNGEIYTVRNDQVNAMLLNEFIKEHGKVQEQNGKIQQQEVTIAELKSTVAQQQKGLQTVTARLEQQAAQIQKVSAQLELSKAAPQTVKNDN
jgi:septal ring factor EnvC (AmiA/AmiB activator)